MAGIDGAVLPGIPQAGDVSPDKNMLMMSGSNLLQFGGALIMGPCDRRPDESLAVVVMMGDMLASDYAINFKDFSTEYTMGGILEGIRYDSRLGISDCPTANKDWIENPVLSIPYGYDLWKGTFESSLGIAGTDDTEPINISATKDPFYILPISGFRTLSINAESADDTGDFIEFNVLIGVRWLNKWILRMTELDPHQEFERELSSWVAAEFTRGYRIYPAPEGYEESSYENDDYHYYSKDFFIEIDSEPYVCRRGPNTNVWTDEELQGWTPKFTGTCPTLAVVKFDGNEIKEIVWQSK